MKICANRDKSSDTADCRVPSNQQKSLKMADIQAKVNAFPYWYHKIPLPQGVVTPGWAPLNPGSYKIPKNLDGKRVLDVGAWDGYLLSLEPNGAKSFVAPGQIPAIKSVL